MKQSKDPYTLPTGHRIQYHIGQFVFLKTDIEQLPRIVSGIELRPNKGVKYYLSSDVVESEHYDMEITDIRDELIIIS